jgi:hypothetical protein
LMPPQSDRPLERASRITIKRSCWESGDWTHQAPDKPTASMEPATHRSSTGSRPSRGRKARTNHDPLGEFIHHLERGQPLRPPSLVSPGRRFGRWPSRCHGFSARAPAGSAELPRLPYSRQAKRHKKTTLSGGFSVITEADQLLTP